MVLVTSSGIYTSEGDSSYYNVPEPIEIPVTKLNCHPQRLQLTNAVGELFRWVGEHAVANVHMAN